MAILKKTLFKQNLDRVNTLVLDTDANSKYFRVTELPDTFTGGKNAFLIQGSEFLVNGTEVKLEIKDSAGETIYYEPAKGNPEPYDGVSKVVSVHIYPDTAFGPCTITILGELSDYVDQNGSITPVPDIWKDSYNVKWQKVIEVNPNLRNTTKIRFYKTPKFEITEQILPIYNRSPLIVTVSSSIDGYAINPAPGDDYRTFNGAVNYQLRINDDTIFSQSMEGLQIQVDGLPQSFSPTLSDIYTSKLAVVNIPYYETSSTSPYYQEVKNFISASFTASYENTSLVFDSNIDSSFARIKITDLNTFTGDVHRVKVFAKSQNWLGDFELLEDVQLESADLLIAETFSSSLNVRKGIFTDPILDAFWITGSISTPSDWQVDDTYLNKSVKLIPQTDSNTTNGLIYFATSESINFTEGTEYQLDFTPLLSSSVANYGNLEVYMTGSSFVDTDINFGYGKRLTTITTPTNFRRFDKQQINFKADKTGGGRLFFVVKSGVWQLTDVSLSTASETSFSPNEVTLNVNVPNKISNEKFEFKFEFYDINNNFVPIDLRQSFTFVGGNDIVAGKDIELTLTNNSFAFNASGTLAFPNLINFIVKPIAITGSITFYSSAYDDTGSLIPKNLTPYPGTLNKINDGLYILTSQSFSGSLTGYKVGSITYTASADGIERYATVFRLNEGKVGQTGPGVVYRGEWSASTDYYRTDTRRDVVLGKYWNGSSLIDRYYLCAVSHTSTIGTRPSDDNTGNSVGSQWSASWDNFSAQFDSVATDILFAQDVYANRTINIGAKGGTPVIALDSDHPTRKNPSIKISASAYNTDGIFLGFDSGSPKMSIRNGSNALLWDGANLTISGSVVATDGRIAGWIIDRDSLRDSSSKIVLNPKIPSIGLFDENSKKRVDIRYGELSSISANTNTISGSTPAITIQGETKTGTDYFDGTFNYSPTYDTITINPNGALTYYLTIGWDSIGNPLIETNDTFEGYVSFDRGIQIRDSADIPIFTLFGNGVTVSGSNQVVSIDNTFASNVLLTFPTATPPNNVYTLYTFYTISGPFWSNNNTTQEPSININSTIWDNANFTATSEIDLIELTNDGFQMLKNENKYFRIKRDDTDGSDLVSARIAGKVIHTVDDANKDALVIQKGNIRLNDGKIILPAGAVANYSSIAVDNTISWGTANIGILTHKSTRPTLFLPNMLRTSDVSSPGVNPFVDVQWVQNGADTGYIVRRTSSKKYKKNIKNWDKSVLSMVNELPIREYNFKSQSDGDAKMIGIIAEELHDIGLPEFVGVMDGKIDNISTSDLVFVLWKAVQELTQKVEELQNKIGN
jgi:hypothetical protein